MDFLLNAMKYFLILFILSAFNLVKAQEIQLEVKTNSVAGWQKIIAQQSEESADPHKSEIFLRPLLKKNLASDRVIYKVLMGNVFANHKDNLNSISNKLFGEAISEASSHQLKALEIWSLLNYAGYLYRYRAMTKALPYFITAREKMEYLGDDQIIFPSQSYMKIGFYMGTIGDNVLAIQYLNKALQCAKYQDDTYASILDNLGYYQMAIGQIKPAEANFLKASAIAKANNNEVRYAKTLGNIAQIYEKKNKLDEAIKLVKRDIALSLKNNSEQNTMFAYTLLGRFLISKRQIDEAEVALKKADEIARSKSYFKINELEILKLKLDILKFQNKENEELATRRRIDILEDSLNKTDGILPLNQANWLLQKRKYEQNIAATNKIIKRESITKNVVFSIICFLIILISFVFIRSNKTLKQTKKQNDERIAGFREEKIAIEERLLLTNQTLDAQIDFLKEKNKQIQKLRREVENLKGYNSDVMTADRNKLDEMLQSHLMTEENWANFRGEFQLVYPVFFAQIKTDFPELTNSNMRIILLQKLGFNNSEIAGLLGVTVDAVKKSKQRLKHKLGIKYDSLVNITLPSSKKSPNILGDRE